MANAYTDITSGTSLGLNLVKTGERPIAETDSTRAARPGTFQATPLMIGDTLYLSTPYSRVVALDAGSGRELWSYDPGAYRAGQPSNGTGFVHRGVAAWSDGATDNPRGDTYGPVAYLAYVPGVLALVFSGWAYGTESMRIQEVSVNSPVGVPIWPLKMLIPVAGVLLALQGVAEMLRCVLCMREGQWPARLHDVDELEDSLQRGSLGDAGQNGDRA